MRVLIVDDEPEYRAYVQVLTRRLGFVAELAADGITAVELLGKSTFDVAVIDQEMPRMRGLEVIAGIRANDSTKSLYVLMLTAREDMETKLSALDAGFDDFLTKTSSEQEIVAKLAAAQRIAQRQRVLDATVNSLYGLATRDELTGVFNRRFFLTETQRLLAEGARVSIILFDLDGFKQVNDRYGHLAGDRILRDVAALFERRTRSEDLIARYGGDEFVMVVAHLGIVHVERIVYRLTEEVPTLRWISDGEEFGIGVTSGIASTQFLDHPTVDQLLHAADRDLYRAKWVRQHPDQRPELYEYPSADRSIDLLPVRETVSDDEPRQERKTKASGESRPKLRT